MIGRLYGLEIRYNNNKPLYCFSAEPAGVGVQLYNGVNNSLTLIVYVKVAEERAQYQLKAVLPGDKLSFQYLNSDNDQSSNINELEALSRAGEPPALQVSESG